MTIEDKLRAHNITLPQAAPPAGSYVPFVMLNGLLYISGQLPVSPDGERICGHLGDTVDIATGQQAARYCALHILAQAKAALGDLNRVTRIVRLGGFVASTPEFTDHPKVINGASDLLVDLLGDAGRHSRAAVGVSALPLGVAVEIDAILAYAD